MKQQTPKQIDVLMGESDIRMHIREVLVTLDRQLSDCDLETVHLTMQGLVDDIKTYMGGDMSEPITQVADDTGDPNDLSDNVPQV